MNSKVKQNLDWLFHFNKDKNDFINFINAREEIGLNHYQS